MITGEIIDFDGADGLGFILLDDGRKIRFTMTSCGYMKPEVGKRVQIVSLEKGYQGQLKATFIQPIYQKKKNK